MVQQTSELQIDELEDGSVSVGGFEEEQEEQQQSSSTIEEEQQQTGEEEEEDEVDLPSDDDAVRAKREARRQERREKKLARQRELQENRELRQRLEEQQKQIQQLSEKTLEGEKFLLQKEIESLNSTIEYARKVRIEAMKEENWQKVEEAERVMENVGRSKVMQELRLQALAEGNSSVAQNTERREKPRQEGDPVAHALATNWALRNQSWFDPDGTDRDSQIAKEEDIKLFNEGNKPNDPAYWVELDKRLKKRLPHRYGAIGQRTPHIGGLSQNRVNSRNSLVVPKEYVDAMKEAGLWDDKNKRDRAIKQYKLNLAKQQLEK